MPFDVAIKFGKITHQFVGGDDLIARLIAPVVTTASIILSSNKTG